MELRTELSHELDDLQYIISLLDMQSGSRGGSVYKRSGHRAGWLLAGPEPGRLDIQRSRQRARRTVGFGPVRNRVDSVYKRSRTEDGFEPPLRGHVSKGVGVCAHVISHACFYVSLCACVFVCACVCLRVHIYRERERYEYFGTFGSAPVSLQRWGNKQTLPHYAVPNLYVA